MDHISDPIAMGFTDEAFPAGTHMCLIYSDENERLDLIYKFLEAGIKAGEKTVYLGDTITPEVLEGQHSKQGIRVAEKEYGNQLNFLNAEEAYCSKGKFDPETMFENFKKLYLESKEEGYPNIRVSGETSWVLKGIPGTERLIEYEAKINDLFSEFPITGVCQYNANHFDGATILDVLKVHPHMIVNGQIIQNPYYLSPEEFLKSQGPEIG